MREWCVEGVEVAAGGARCGRRAVSQCRVWEEAGGCGVPQCRVCDLCVCGVCASEVECGEYHSVEF